MIKAEFQVIRRVLGEHWLARQDRLPQQYAIDVGKQVHPVTLSDGDTAAWESKTIVVPSRPVKRLGEIFRIARLRHHPRIGSLLERNMICSRVLIGEIA